MTQESTENTDPTINLALKVSEVNAILAGVQELPFKVADSLLKNIVAQAQSQFEQPVALEETIVE